MNCDLENMKLAFINSDCQDSFRFKLPNIIKVSQFLDNCYREFFKEVKSLAINEVLFETKFQRVG